MQTAIVVLIAVALLGALIAAISALNFALRRFRDERSEVERIRTTFSRYVSPKVVEELLNRKDERILSGRETRATILVCRIWNFSRFIEDLSPEQTLRYLNEFYAIAGTSIERQQGMLHHFLDDGVVGIFGVPLEDPEQEDHALRAAINMVRLVALMEETWVQQNRRPMRIGVGINSGNVIAGDAGFSKRREYTVVGPDVTLAHRLAAGTVDINAYIVAARATVEPVQDLYNLVPVTGVPLNGVRALLDAFIIRGRKRGDTLVFPRPGTFANTVLGGDDATSIEPLDPQETVPFDIVDESRKPSAAPSQPAPETPPRPERADAVLKTRRRPRPETETPMVTPFGHDLPELRMPNFGNDEGPIMPDPPPPRATYEDNDGPPLPL
jgi:class 3 adenylate cyclase